MNENELQIKIKELRQQGWGYKKIAKELSITIGTVRYACSKDENDPELISNCKNCGLKIKSLKGKKSKIFCSDKCRLTWWNNNQNKVDKKAYYSHQCIHCNKKFSAYGNNKRLYCSQECYIEHKKIKGDVGNGTK